MAGEFAVKSLESQRTNIKDAVVQCQHSQRVLSEVPSVLYKNNKSCVQRKDCFPRIPKQQQNLSKQEP